MRLAHSRQKRLDLTRSQRILIGVSAFVGSMIGSKIPFLGDRGWGAFFDGTVWFADGKTILWGIAGRLRRRGACKVDCKYSDTNGGYVCSARGCGGCHRTSWMLPLWACHMCHTCHTCHTSRPHTQLSPFAPQVMDRNHMSSTKSISWHIASRWQEFEGEVRSAVLRSIC